MTGPLDKLTKAVLELDQEMVKLDSLSKAKAGEIVRRADALALELENDIMLILRELVEDIQETVKKKSEELRAKYAAEKEEKIRLTKFSAETNKEEAVKAVLEEIRKLLTEV